MMRLQAFFVARTGIQIPTLREMCKVLFPWYSHVSQLRVVE